MSLPPELSKLWNFLHPEVVWLHACWVMFCELYGMSPERINLLNAVSPTFFSMVQRVVMNDVQLTLVKLSDPAKMGSNENSTLETFVIKSEELQLAELSKNLRASLNKYRDCCKKIKQRRDKDIVHFDQQVHLGGKTTELPGPSRKEIGIALAELRRFMNYVWEKFE
ncbi:MAG: hypothetical protein ACREBW_04580, partial [Candidatus Micrarchaeaceae archaeon]